MQAEVLSVGTELLLGQTVNTDTTIVAKALSMLGIDLLYAAVVGDNVKRLEKAVHDALERSDILITTGGLGPTGDDLTKETVAAAAGKALALHEPSYKRLMEYFARGGLSENQIKQAMLPEGCTVLQNDNGTAPGCAFQTAAGKLVVMLPGPPSELEPMLQNYAVPYLAQFQSAVIASHSVHVFGRGEAAVAEMIADLTENSNPTAAPYAKEGEMFVRVRRRPRRRRRRTRSARRWSRRSAAASAASSTAWASIRSRRSSSMRCAQWAKRSRRRNPARAACSQSV